MAKSQHLHSEDLSQHLAVMEATEVVMERMSGRGGLIVNTASLAGVGDGGDHRDHADHAHHDDHDDDHDNH